MIMLRIGTLYYFVYNSILHGTEFYEFLQSLATVYESTREMIKCYRYFTKFDEESTKYKTLKRKLANINEGNFAYHRLLSQRFALSSTSNWIGEWQRLRPCIWQQLE